MAKYTPSEQMMDRIMRGEVQGASRNLAKRDLVRRVHSYFGTIAQRMGFSGRKKQEIILECSFSDEFQRNWLPNYVPSTYDALATEVLSWAAQQTEPHPAGTNYEVQRDNLYLVRS